MKHWISKDQNKNKLFQDFLNCASGKQFSQLVFVCWHLKWNVTTGVLLQRKINKVHSKKKQRKVNKDIVRKELNLFKLTVACFAEIWLRLLAFFPNRFLLFFYMSDCCVMNSNELSFLTELLTQPFFACLSILFFFSNAFISTVIQPFVSLTFLFRYYAALKSRCKSSFLWNPLVWKFASWSCILSPDSLQGDTLTMTMTVFMDSHRALRKMCGCSTCSHKFVWNDRSIFVKELFWRKLEVEMLQHHSWHEL